MVEFSDKTDGSSLDAEETGKVDGGTPEGATDDTHDTEIKSSDTRDDSDDTDERLFYVTRGEAGLLTPGPRLKIHNRDTGRRIEKETLGTLISPFKDSVIEDEQYEVKLNRAEFHEAEFHISAATPNGGHQEIRRSYSQVEAVDYEDNAYKNSTISLHIGEYIYSIKINYSIREHSEVKEAVQQIRERVEDARGNEGDDGGDDGLDKLRKLSELKEEGVISEEDFEETKTKILDNI